MSVWVGGGREELCVQCELWRGRSVNLCVHRCFKEWAKGRKWLK